MSVEKTPNGKHRVRWREAGRARSRTVDRKSEADRLDAEIRRRLQLGSFAAAIDTGTVTLHDFAYKWWEAHAVHLAPSTRVRYAQVLDTHIVPRLGDYRLHQLSPAVIDDFRIALERVGRPTALKARAVLSDILGYAVVRGELAANPVRQAPAPRQRRTTRPVRPLAPATVERLRARLGPRDAMLVSVLAYAGLRPSEALGMHWSHVRQQTLLVEGGVVLGEERDTKTYHRRKVRLLAPLAQDLRQWRLAAGRPDDRELVFPRPDGEPWFETDYRNWRRRVFKPAWRTALGLGEKDPTPRPYDLRHSFASLLLAEGRVLTYVADQMGHGVDVLARTYAHVIDELEDAPRIDAEAEILRARGAGVARVSDTGAS